MRLNIRLTFNSKTETITVPDNLENIAALKAAVASQIADVGEFRLVFAGKVLKDDDVLAQCGVRDGVTVHLVRSKAPAKAPEPQQPAEPQAQPRQPNYYTGPIAGEQPQQQNQQPQPNFGGMGMGGFPNMAGMGGNPMMGGMGMDGMMQMMQQNPEMLNQAIDFLVQNPQMFRQILMSNPMTAQMMQNPQMSGMIEQMLANPEMLRMMMSPQMMQMASQMGGMGMGGMNGMGMGGMGMPPQQPAQPAPQQTQPQQPMNTQPQANPFGSLFGQPMNAVPQQPPMNTQPQQPVQQQRNPRDIYQSQLNSLREMGFFDEEENIRALQRTGGNVNAAVELLLQGIMY